MNQQVEAGDYDGHPSYRVLHVLDHSLPIQTGYAFRSAAILAGQADLGWRTWQVTSSKHDVEVDLDLDDVNGQLYYRTKSNRPRWLPGSYFEQVAVVRSLVRRLRELLATTDPQIIHAYSPCLNGIAALIVAREYRLPVVYEMRSSWEDAAVTRGTAAQNGLRYRISRKLETSVLRRVDSVTTICDGLRRDIVQRGISEERVTVVPNAVDRHLFEQTPRTSSEVRARYAMADQVLVGYIGSFHAYEGLELLMRAIAHLGASRKKFRFVLIGGGTAESAIRSAIRQLGLEETVVIAGQIPHADLPDYYRAMDFLVYPRLRTALTDKVTPLKPLEAMAQRVVVLASDIGGHRELIRNGETGILFQPDDVGAMASAILGVLDRRDLDVIRENAFRYVSLERTWAKCILRYADVYERVLNPRNRIEPG